MHRFTQLLRQLTRITLFVVRVLFVRSRRTAKCILLASDNEVLLVRHRIGSGSWTIPGGGVHRKEEAADAAIRELGEEVGIDIDEIESVSAFFLDRGYGVQDEVLLFVGSTENKEIDRDWLEILDARWFSLDALPDDLGVLARESLVKYQEYHVV